MEPSRFDANQKRKRTLALDGATSNHQERARNRGATVDLIFLGLVLVFFGLSLGLVAWLEQL